MWIQEVSPGGGAVSTGASGRFQGEISKDGSTITYTLSYSSLEGDVRDAREVMGGRHSEPLRSRAHSDGTGGARAPTPGASADARSSRRGRPHVREKTADARDHETARARVPH